MPSSSPGARTLTWWPSAMSVSARSRTWFCTPPGTSNEYGQTIPIRNAPPLGHGADGRLVEPEPLEHVPVLRVPGDALGERVGDPLRDDPDPGVEGALGDIRHGDRTGEVPGRRIRIEPHLGHAQGGARAQGEQRRAGGARGAAAEEAAGHPARGEAPGGGHGDDG